MTMGLKGAISDEKTFRKEIRLKRKNYPIATQILRAKNTRVWTKWGKN